MKVVGRPAMLIAGVTGAVGGALLRLVRPSGWDVVGVYRSNEEAAEHLMREWGDASGTLRLLRADLAEPAEIATLLQALPPDYCPDALVHLASPAISAAALHRTGWEEYRRQIDGTLKPVVLLTQPLIGRMLRRGSGRIIAALSAVVFGTPPRGFSSYTTAKYALAGYLRCMAAEYAGRGIATNMVSPGPMETSLLRQLPALLTEQMRQAIPGGNWIEPISVARAILWLAADAGPEVSGCNLPLTSAMTF